MLTTLPTLKSRLSLIPRNCVISLHSAFSLQHSAFAQARITYTGGYLLPGSPPPDPPVASCQDLPDDLEQAAVEQVTCWFQRKERLGLRISWPSGGVYEQFVIDDLLPCVTAVLNRYQRFIL